MPTTVANHFDAAFAVPESDKPEPSAGDLFCFLPMAILYASGKREARAGCSNFPIFFSGAPMGGLG